MSIVVLVDEEPALLEILGMVLERDGHEVRRAGTRETALRLIAHARPEVIVCSDAALIAIVRALPALAGVAFVLLVDPDDPVRPLAAAVHVIAKPVVLVELLRAVRQR